MQISIIHPIPSPYREKLFAELAGLDSIDLKVYYCAQSVASYPDWEFAQTNYSLEFLPGWGLGRGFLFNPAIVNRLQAKRPDILAIWGWSYPTAQIALLVSRALRIPTVLFSAGALPLYRSRPRNEISAKLIRQVKQLLIKMPQAFLVPGKLAKQYLFSFGVKADRVHVVPINCLDTDRWRSQAQSARQDANQIKGRLGMVGKRVILYVGRLVPGKGLPVLLDAYEGLRQQLSDTALLIVGGGSEKASLESKVIHRELPDVHFVGPQPYEALPQFYGLADCLVLPTFSDTWGLVVLEAMACGLPVVTTTSCSAVPDLIDDRGTGLVVEPGNASALAQAIKDIISLSPPETEAMRQRAFATAVEYDYRVAARRFADVLALELNRYLGVDRA